MRRCGEQAAGAAFGGGEGEVAHAEHEQDDLFERFAVGGEDVVAHLGSICSASSSTRAWASACVGLAQTKWSWISPEPARMVVSTSGYCL